VKGATASGRNGCLGTVELVGVLATGGLVTAEGAAGIARILILNAILVHVDGVARRIERETVEESMKSSGTGLCTGRQKRGDADQKFKQHLYYFGRLYVCTHPRKKLTRDP